MDLKTLEKLHNQTLDICKEKCSAEITDNTEGCMIVILMHLTTDIFDLLSMLQSKEVSTDFQGCLVSTAKRIDKLFMLPTGQKTEMLSIILATLETIEELKQIYN